MNETDREIKESPLYIGEDEKPIYCLTTTPWGSSPGSVSVVMKDADGTDVSSTNLSGSASVSGDVITLPTIQSLTAGALYRLEIKFTTGSSVLEPWAAVWGQT